MITKNTINKLPSELLKIRDFLKSYKLNLTKPTRDGRINSSFNEDEIINILSKNNFAIERPTSRAWYDMSINSNKEFIPINIKVTNTNTADNLNCKLGIYYALTGYFPNFSNGINWLNYFEKLSKNFGSVTTKDYYFLIVNKQDNQDIFLTSLKSIRKLQPNGNNLPFQCKWSENKEMIDRNFDEAANYIMNTFAQSIKQRAEIYFNFKKYFPKYV